jgi:acyl-[acyl-carrier-protein] desaturase
MMHELEPFLATLMPQLRPVEACWQPSELLPNMGTEGWHDDVKALRAEARHLTDEMLIVLVGNVVTEEALPSYQTALNRFGGQTDVTGTDTHAWARWSRGWTAEEKRHGDVTRTYLYLSGRVDLRAVEDTVQHLLRNGFDTKAAGDPYLGLAYASFQEHATKTCWNQLGKVVGDVGAGRLHRICGIVAADEARHERVYAALLREVVRRDPVDGMLALHETFGHSVVMPALTMTDGEDPRLFAHFSDVGQRLGVYTMHDYVENLSQLIDTLGIATMTGINGEAGKARDELCAMPARLTAMADERAARRPRPVPFRWIQGRRA